MWITLACFLAATAIGGAQTAAPWTAAGSTGVPDEEDAGAVEFGQTGLGISILHEAAFVKSSAPAPIEVDLRYNVVAVGGLVTGGPYWSLTARLRDAGAAVFFARLIQVNIGTGKTTELLTLQSNLFPDAAGFRRLSTGRAAAVLGSGVRFPFSEEPLLCRSDAREENGNDGQPAIVGLQIAPTTCR